MKLSIFKKLVLHKAKLLRLTGMSACSETTNRGNLNNVKTTRKENTNFIIGEIMEECVVFNRVVGLIGWLKEGENAKV